MQSYHVEIVGKMPLLMHADNIEWADQMDRWKAEPDAQKVSKPGDDRSPAFRWLGSLYYNDEHIALPHDNLMRCFMEGGALVPVPKGRNGKTFKAQTQSGMLIDGSHWPILINGQPIPAAPIFALRSEPVFSEHQRRVADFGFALHLKRAKVGQSKHVRVRPLFEKWSAAGVIHVWDEQITKEALTQIVTQAGRYKGLGDWRPGGKTPGPFGVFTATVR